MSKNVVNHNEFIIQQYISGLGMEGKCMGEGERYTDGALHSGAE